MLLTSALKLYSFYCWLLEKIIKSISRVKKFKNIINIICIKHLKKILIDKKEFQNEIFYLLSSNKNDQTSKTANCFFLLEL